MDTVAIKALLKKAIVVIGLAVTALLAAKELLEQVAARF